VKTNIVLAVLTLSSALLLGGCVGGVNLGGGPKTEVHNPSLGQQLIDLQKAREAGAISQAEYEAKKAELLAKK
jgi:hypothetical protein